VNLTVLDFILSIYTTTLDQGYQALLRYSLPILGVFALIAWCTALWGTMLGAGDGLSTAMTSAVSIGIWYWFSIFLGAMAIAAFDTFTQFGAAVGIHGAPGSFLIPSKIWALGWEAARPILAMAQAFTGWSVLINIFVIGILYASALAIVFAYGFMAFFVILIQIEFRLAIMLGAVLIPLGVYQGTTFMAEWGLGLLCGSLVRTFITTALLAISGPLISLVKPERGPTGDPTFETALVMAFVAGSFIVLLLVTARKASTIAVRGLGLGLGSGGAGLGYLLRTGGAILSGAGGLAIQGASRLLAGQRGR